MSCLPFSGVQAFVWGCKCQQWGKDPGGCVLWAWGMMEMEMLLTFTPFFSYSGFRGFSYFLRFGFSFYSWPGQLTRHVRSLDSCQLVCLPWSVKALRFTNDGFAWDCPILTDVLIVRFREWASCAVLSRFSRAGFCATPWAVAHQPPLSRGFSSIAYASEAARP